jgi:hypothetical protein
MDTQDKHLEHLAAIQALTGDSTWSSWSSPIGLIIFLNGLALLGILIRFAFLMK